MKALFDKVSVECSELITRRYSTSFTLGIKFLDKSLRAPVYAIYGFVRCADEIVDSFHDYNKEELLEKFRRDTYSGIEDSISANPVINSFQSVVHEFNIERRWIDLFFQSMEMDLKTKVYDKNGYDEYVLGSAEAVGLMCLHVFTGGNKERFEELKPYAMKLGAAFQKVNFLRDVKSDMEILGRTYFPELDMKYFTSSDKKKIEEEIEADFVEALKGIRLLPNTSRRGVYLAYYYYTMLFKKIRRMPPNRILKERIRIPNSQKLILLLKSNLKVQLNML